MELRGFIRNAKKELYALYFAFNDPRLPWYVRAFLALVVAYAFSPIDLIPDFIPVIGYLDDAILVPFGIWLALKMIPFSIMEECREKAANSMEAQGYKSRTGGIIIVAIWIIAFILVGWWLVGHSGLSSYLRSDTDYGKL